MIRVVARGLKSRAPAGCPEVGLVAGIRTPFLASGGAFKELRPHDLQRHALLGLCKVLGPDFGQHVEKIVCGNVIHEVKTSNVAREAALSSGAFPLATPAHSVTMACISSSMAVGSCVDSVRSGQADVAVAGGVESMSDVPIRFSRNVRRAMIASQKARGPAALAKLVLGLKLKDLAPELPAIAEFSTNEVMGHSADRLCSRWGVTRAEQDAFALRSHVLAGKAWDEGRFADEVMTVMVPPGRGAKKSGGAPPAMTAVSRDNLVRGDLSAAKLASLRPAFVKPHGTVTAGNSSALTDGASACVLASAEGARRLGRPLRSVVRDYVFVGNDPFEELLLGPAYAVARLLERNGLKASDVQVYELHEAFAGQVLANLNALDSDEFARTAGVKAKVGAIDHERINTRGGSCSLGHPFGATGTRLLFTASNRLHEEDGQYAVLAACAAGGLGHAMLIERV
eukprot:TRINITY_DN779_c0_g1_i1.p1 TRINITY_DN779_c0_g1~~TRINITY_DN779_c0_g1_i1.p1  ORF type:complete len:455 (-),score=190.56 TRINITY_DN779_c0_g1_i1:40-1404(-)